MPGDGSSGEPTTMQCSTATTLALSTSYSNARNAYNRPTKLGQWIVNFSVIDFINQKLLRKVN